MQKEFEPRTPCLQSPLYRIPMGLLAVRFYLSMLLGFVSLWTIHFRRQLA